MSENYRASIEGPENRLAEKIADAVSWALVLGFLAFLGWQAWSTPKAPW